MNSPFCQVHTPCPLGEDRARFLHLVGEIAQRGDVYPAQLSALTLARLSVANESGEETEQAITRALLPKTGKAGEEALAGKAAAEKREKLWQARLVLAIGELLDRQQLEITRHLKRLDTEEIGLLQTLHGDEDLREEAELFNVHKPLFGSQPETTHAGNIARRFAAWRRLYREADLHDSSLLLTSSRDAADLLIDTYEALAQRQTAPITTLLIPASIGDSEQEAMAAVSTFAERNHALLDHFATLLPEMAGDGSPSPVELEKSIASWQVKLEAAFPAEQFGRQQLRILLLAGISCPALFGITPGTAAPGNTLLLTVG